jgi:hypothetical protein
VHIDNQTPAQELSADYTRAQHDRYIPVGSPVRIVIPSLGIDSPTISVGSVRGTIGTPCDPLSPVGFASHGYSLTWWHAQCDPNATAWYRGSARPGDAGNAIIDGHVDWYGDPHDPHGSPPVYSWLPDIDAVFAHLDRIAVGAQINVIDDLGERHLFEVDAIQRLPNPQTPTSFLTTTGAPTLTLVTCAGVFASLDTGMTERLYIQSHLVSPR